MISIPIHSGQAGNEVRLQPLNSTQLVMLEILGMPNSNLGVPGGRPALGSGPLEVITLQLAQGSASTGVPKGRHASTCLGICTLTWGLPALRLQQYWVGYASERLPLKEVHPWK